LKNGTESTLHIRIFRLRFSPFRIESGLLNPFIIDPPIPQSEPGMRGQDEKLFHRRCTLLSTVHLQRRDKCLLGEVDLAKLEDLLAL
jgi:hypothetical protein